MKKKILEMYAYYYGILKDASFLLSHKLSDFNLKRGTIQRAYKELKDFNLDIKLIEFLYFVDLAYILLITKEFGAINLKEVIDMINNDIQEETTNNLKFMLLSNKYIERTKKPTEMIVKKAFELVFEKELKQKEFDLFCDKVIPEKAELIRGDKLLKLNTKTNKREIIKLSK